MTTTQTSGNPTDEPGAREKAQHVAGTAADEGRRVAGTARQETSHVAGEARDQARELLSQARTQVEEQSREQQQHLAGTVRTFSDDLSDMASDRNGLASDLARETANRARSLASQLENREPRDLLEDVREFARRRPGTFLLGALTAGLVVGRFTRAAQAANQEPAQPAASDGSSMLVASENPPYVETGPVTGLPASGSSTTVGATGAISVDPLTGTAIDERELTDPVMAPDNTARPQPGSEV